MYAYNLALIFCIDVYSESRLDSCKVQHCATQASQKDANLQGDKDIGGNIY